MHAEAPPGVDYVELILSQSKMDQFKNDRTSIPFDQFQLSCPLIF